MVVQRRDFCAYREPDVYNCLPLLQRHHMRDIVAIIWEIVKFIFSRKCINLTIHNIHTKLLKNFIKWLMCLHSDIRRGNIRPGNGGAYIRRAIHRHHQFNSFNEFRETKSFLNGKSRRQREHRKAKQRSKETKFQPCAEGEEGIVCIFIVKRK